MEISSSGEFNINAPTLKMNSHVNVPEKVVKEVKSDIYVSISSEARDKYDAEQNKTTEESAEKKDFGESLRVDGSQLNSSKTEKKPLSLEEKIEQRIDELKEKIKEIQKEIQALRANSGEQAEEKIKILEQQMQALLGELNSLMEQKLESMK